MSLGPNDQEVMECKPNCSEPKVLTTFWFTWKWLFDNHAWNWSFNMDLILYKHLVNVFQKTHLWWWPAEFCHFWRFLSLLSLRDSLWAFNRHKFDYRVPSRADCERQKLLVQVNWVLQVDMGFLLKTRRQFHTIEVPTCCFLMWSTIQNNYLTTTLSKSLQMNRMIKMNM